MEHIQTWLSSLDRECCDQIRNIQVFVCSFQINEDSIGTEFKMDSADHGVCVKISRCYGSSDDFAQHFQNWLVEQPGETEHLLLQLPPAEKPLSLSLDLSATLLSPHCVPFSHRLTLSTEPLIWQATSKKQVTVPVLQVQCRVERSALCQSVMYGEPLVARATEAWSLPWQQASNNSQFVVALVRQLRQTDSVLVCRLAPAISGAQSNTRQVSGSVALMPGGESDEFLLVTLTPAELLLPSAGHLYSTTHVSAQAEQIVGEHLEKVPSSSRYSPLQQPCGIHQALSVISSVSSSSSIPLSSSSRRFNQAHSTNRKLNSTASGPPNNEPAPNVTRQYSGRITTRGRGPYSGVTTSGRGNCNGANSRGKGDCIGVESRGRGICIGANIQERGDCNDVNAQEMRDGISVKDHVRGGFSGGSTRGRGQRSRGRALYWNSQWTAYGSNENQ